MAFLSLIPANLKAESECCNEKKVNQEADEKLKQEKPPEIGNFALPTSQQPSALFGFGANVIDKGEVQLFLAGDAYLGSHRTISDINPSVLFGVTDDLSIYFNFPFAPYYSDQCKSSNGFEDFFVQLEYVIFNKSTRCYVDQATFVSNVTLPTGSTHKYPPTGFGAPSVFLGATFYRMMVKWFAFTSQGAVLTTSHHRTQFGYQFLYQFGIGRNIPSPKGWIYAWMLELDGQYNKKNILHGTTDKDSGGNTLYLNPSLWFSSKYTQIQCGIIIPLNQNLYGDQRKFNYGLNINMAWSFY